MRHHLGMPAALIVATVLAGSVSVVAQRPAPTGGQTWTVPRTADGHPDLQGIWTNATLTPLERPRHLADRSVLTEAEAASLEEQVARLRASSEERRASGDVGSYNQFWFDSGTKVMPSRQTSLVVDPPDGRVPVRPEAEARRDEYLRRSTEAPEFMSMWDRCISRGVPGWIIPAGYNNAYQILQTSKAASEPWLPSQFRGTSRSNSSNQCWTTTRCGARRLRVAGSTVFSMRNRLPSGATS
jgi:hypothetical protein